LAALYRLPLPNKFGHKLATMDNERIRAICLAFPHVTETVNWGHHLVYWVGNRDSGGKMFAMTDLDGTGTGVLWFHCGAERFHELLETDGIIASPYLAKAGWVTVERWNVLRPRAIEDELGRAHALIYEKLPKRTQTLLALPENERLMRMRERKKILHQRKKAAAEPGKKGTPGGKTPRPARNTRKK
jgi:predicted DNA-binding protein (MmcQ/YjbR family)